MQADLIPVGDRWETTIGGVRVVYGDGRLDELGNLALELGGSKALLVTDAGVRAAGHSDRAQSSLNKASLEVLVFDEVDENPTSDQVEAGRSFAAGKEVDLLIGLGGGSAMDCAKGVNFLLTNGGQMEDYWGYDRTSRPLLPAIGVPTTAGTGSEAQSYALITDTETHRKMACGDRQARFRIDILDPSLCRTAPSHTAVASGLDAVAHAVESFVSTKSHTESRRYSQAAWNLLDEKLTRTWTEAADSKVYGDVLLAAHLAGAAIEQSMLGAGHACANPLTARFGITHGVAVSLMLPHVVRFNGPVASKLYAELLGASHGQTADPATTLATRLEELHAAGGLASTLRSFDIPKSHLPELARDAAKEWTAGFNPRPVGEEELLALYEAAY